MSEVWSRIFLAFEFAALFFGIPLFMFLDTRFSLPSIILVPVLVLIFLILRYKTDFRWKELVYWRVPGKRLARDGLILLCCAVSLILVVLILMQGNFLNLPRANPWIWLVICVFYPVFSAYPQEILFRTYIFRRYKNPYRIYKITNSYARRVSIL